MLCLSLVLPFTPPQPAAKSWEDWQIGFGIKSKKNANFLKIHVKTLDKDKKFVYNTRPQTQKSV